RSRPRSRASSAGGGACSTTIASRLSLGPLSARNTSKAREILSLELIAQDLLLRVALVGFFALRRAWSLRRGRRCVFVPAMAASRDVAQESRVVASSSYFWGSSPAAWAELAASR